SNTRNQSDRHAESSHQSHFKNSTTENNKTFNRKHRSKNDSCRNSDYIIPFKKLLQYKMNLLCIMEVQDRKSTRLNSSHVSISYAVFCLKKKKKICTI